MLSVFDALPAELSEVLIRHNIRFVEQFLAMLRTPGGARSLAEASGKPVDELQAIAERVQAEHADLKVPVSSGRDYGLGYGRKADWERVGASVTHRGAVA